MAARLTKIRQSALLAVAVALIVAAPHAQDRPEPTRVPEPSARIDYSTVQGVTLRAHGFFNAGRPAYQPVLTETLRFLRSELEE